MVYEITKSADGTRKLLPSSPIVDLLKSLRGLTFKIEVKISDVVQNSPQTTEKLASTPSQVSINQLMVSKSSSQASASSTQNLKNRELDSKTSHTSAPTAAVNPALTLIGQQIQNIASGKTMIPSVVQAKLTRDADDFEREIASIKKPVAIAKSAEVAKVEIEKSVQKQPTTSEVKVKETRIQQEAASVEKTRSNKPIMTLTRGQLKIGSTIESCCIAVDDTQNPPVAYIAYDNKKLIDIGNKIDEKLDEIEESASVTILNVGDIVLARSQEDNKWYRSIVEEINKDMVLIFFFDWGLRETLPKSHIKYLSHACLGLADNPACAIKLQFLNRDPRIVEEVLLCESSFKMKIESYDISNEGYNVFVEEIFRV